jgi:hypothetical protein
MSTAWTRYDVPSMTHVFNRPFEHFAELDQAFDFHVAARKDNPTPISIPGHIANLLRPSRDNHPTAGEFRQYRCHLSGDLYLQIL